MKKKVVIPLLSIIFLGMAIATSGGFSYMYFCFPPSVCQQCMYEQCLCHNVPPINEPYCWCHNNCDCIGAGTAQTGDCPLPQGCDTNCLSQCCQVEAFQWCQERWFHPYWMEIYNNEVKGCYAKDLLCFNHDILINNRNGDGICPEVCGPYCRSTCIGANNPEECYNECMQNCCEKADCYLYGKPSIAYAFLPDYNGRLILNIPPCENSRSFFNQPPPCGGVFETDSAVLDAVAQFNGDGIILDGCCFDLRGCGNTPLIECAKSCETYDMPPNYRCDVNEIVILSLEAIDPGIKINGRTYEFNQQCPEWPSCTWWIVWYNGDKPFNEVPGVVYVNQGVPRTIIIEGEVGISFDLEQKCCYDCKEKPPLPSSILYPKVDIETLSIAGGPTVIKDGKILSSLTISPGIQQAMIQVENRGFFTQNDSRVRFEGLPSGVTVSIQPDTQKITAHNIGTYSAIFTVDPNVPSGTYKVTMIAYSPNGVFDTITIDFVVP